MLGIAAKTGSHVHISVFLNACYSHDNLFIDDLVCVCFNLRDIYYKFEQYSPSPIFILKANFHAFNATKRTQHPYYFKRLHIVLSIYKIKYILIALRNAGFLVK